MIKIVYGAECVEHGRRHTEILQFAKKRIDMGNGTTKNDTGFISISWVTG